MPAVKKQIRKRIQPKKPASPAKREKRPSRPLPKDNSSGAFYEKVMSLFCYLFSLTATILALAALHLTGEVEVNSLLAAAPTYSKNLSYFEPLHPDMPIMDNLAETFVRQYITATSTVYKNAHEQAFLWHGVVPHMAVPSVLEPFQKRTEEIFNGEAPPKLTVDTHIRKIIKEGWNSWQILFDTRTLEQNLVDPKIEHWIATIQFRYYAFNRIMTRRFKNPMGFTVTQYNLAQQKTM